MLPSKKEDETEGAFPPDEGRSLSPVVALEGSKTPSHSKPTRCKAERGSHRVGGRVGINRRGPRLGRSATTSEWTASVREEQTQPVRELHQ